MDLPQASDGSDHITRKEKDDRRRMWRRRAGLVNKHGK